MKIWIVLLISLTPFYLFAQTNLGPRLTAMGDNGAAIIDIWAIQANPAGIIGVIRPSISLNYIKHLFGDDLSTQSLAAIIPLNNNFFGLSLQRYGFSEYNENKLGFAFAKKFSNHLSIGVNINYHQLKIPEYGSSTGFSAEIGALYQFEKAFTLGVFVRNPSKQSYNSSEILATVPTSLNIGLSYQASDKVLIAATCFKNLNQPTDVKLGIEYKMFDLLSLRGGLSFKPFKQYCGLGLNYKEFLMDMATTYDANLGYTPQIALGYAF
jgi:long-subunit fatty acid transport protein